jgi:hypothetical protein
MSTEEQITLASEIEAQRLQLFKAGILDCIMHSLNRSTIPIGRAGYRQCRRSRPRLARQGGRTARGNLRQMGCAIMTYHQRYFVRYGGLVHWAVIGCLIVINWHDVKRVQPVD